jgi:hypothetical protein
MEGLANQTELENSRPFQYSYPVLELLLSLEAEFSS